MAELKARVEIDTRELNRLSSDIDRMAIGARLYDMFNMRQMHNKIHYDDGLYMHEKDINAMFQLVNNTDRAIRVYRP